MTVHYLQQRATPLFTFFSLLFCSFSVLSAQTQFIGPANGDWFTASNWSAGLPAAGNDANISGGASVNIAQPLVVNFGISNFGTINNSATLEIAKNLVSGGALNNTATGSITIDAAVQLIASGGLNNAGTVINKGSVNINTAAFINAGTVSNQGTWQQLAPLKNTGTVNNLSGLFTSPQIFTNTGIVANATGANWTVDFGGSFLNNTGGTFSNAGTFTNSANFTNNTTITNSGTFTNNSAQNCNGVFNNISGGSLINAGTLAISGRLNNPTGATVQNNNIMSISANGFISNSSTAFNNNNKLTVQLKGTFSNEVGGVLTLGVGSILTDSGYVKNTSGAKIIGSGSINNAGILDNFGTLQADNGSVFTNTDTVNNHGYFVTASIVNNSGYVGNDSLIRISSGAVFNNFLKIFNKLSGTIEDNYDFNNKTGATLTNNGTVINNIRLTNDGTVTNNGYLLLAGDFFNHGGATLANTEVVEINAGSIVNAGIVTNTKTIYNDACSVISNNAGGSISNSSVLKSNGVIFQRGTFTGNAVAKTAGWIQTAPTSDAKICVDTIRTGTTPQGEAKVYPQNVLLRIGLDSCNNFQYSVDGTTRRVYTCADAGKVLDAKFVLKLRTGDSLTCSTKVSVFDGIAPVLSSCPANANILTTNTSEVYSWATITALDNCTGPAKVVSTTASGSAFSVGTTLVTITATDTFKNTALCSFKVTVTKVISTATCTIGSKTPPTITNCPQNITITSILSGAAVSWNEPTISATCYPVTIASNYSSGAFFPSGVTSVVYTATDVNKNVGTCTFNVTVTTTDPCVTDNVKPSIVGCPANLFLIANPANNSSVGVWQAPTASDNCGVLTLTNKFNSGTLFPAGSTTVTYTATDAKNNTSVCSFIVSVAATKSCTSTAPPVFVSCPKDVTVNANGNSASVSWTEPTATSACGNVTINANYFSGSNFTVGTTKVIYSASDIVGNASVCSFNVKVNNPCLMDTIVPVISGCPANVSVQTTNTTSTVTWTAPTATDNCGTASLVSNYTSGGSFPVGVTTVTYSAYDASGNKSLPCSFTVTVTKPTIMPTCGVDLKVQNYTYLGNFGGSDYYKWTGGSNPNYTSAVALCSPVGGRLPIIKSEDQNDFIQSKLGSSNCWLGLSRNGTGWLASDGTNATYFNWNSGEPNNYGGNENAVQMYSFGKWNDININATNACIVEVPCKVPACPAPKTFSNWTFIGSIDNKNYYKFTNTSFNDGYINYHIAQNLCYSIGGKLPLIKNQAENDLIKTGLAGANGWLGIERTCYGGNNWQYYADQSTPTFFNWYPGEPNNYGGNENSVQMYGEGRWNDCVSWGSNVCIAEIPCSVVREEEAHSAKVFVSGAAADGNRARVDFSTNRGFETDYFNVKKLNTTTGIFETLVIVKNTVSDNSLQAHSVYDNTPQEGDNYYQVEIALNNGTKTMSDINKVNFTRVRGLILFPNPASEYIEVNLKDYAGKDVTIYVYNALGITQLVREVQNVNGLIPEHLDINNFASGQYLLRVQSKGVRDAVKTLIKN